MIIRNNNWPLVGSSAAINLTLRLSNCRLARRGRLIGPLSGAATRPRASGAVLAAGWPARQIIHPAATFRAAELKELVRPLCYNGHHQHNGKQVLGPERRTA